MDIINGNKPWGYGTTFIDKNGVVLNFENIDSSTGWYTSYISAIPQGNLCNIDIGVRVFDTSYYEYNIYFDEKLNCIVGEATFMLVGGNRPLYLHLFNRGIIGTKKFKMSMTKQNYNKGEHIVHGGL